MRILFLLALILYFTSGCAGAPAKPEAPESLKTPPIGAGPEAKSEIPPASASASEMDAAFAKAEEEQAAEAQLEYETQMPRECQDAPEAKRRQCWHLYIRTSDSLDAGEECEYSFQCGAADSPRTCQFGADSSRTWLSICTYKLPGEK